MAEDEQTGIEKALDRANGASTPFAGGDIVAKIQEADRRGFNPFYLLILSGVAFIVVGGLNSNWVSVLGLGGVVAIHELGHLLAMKVFGYRNTRILFLPLVGGLATGIPSRPNAAKEGIVAIMGPMTGLISALVFILMGHVTMLPLYYQLARLSIVINLFNLVPVLPLDGGRVLQSAIFDRSFAAEILFRIAGVFALAGFGVVSGNKFVGVVATALLFRVRETYLDKKIMERLRVVGVPVGTELDAEAAQSISDALVEVENIAKKPNTKISYVANRVRQLHQKLSRDTSSVSASIGLSVAYFATIVTGTMLLVLGFGSGA